MPVCVYPKTFTSPGPWPEESESLDGGGRGSLRAMGAGTSLKAVPTAQPSRRDSVRDHLMGLEQSFPMYVVRIKDVLGMEQLLPHQTLLAAGMITPYSSDMGLALFVSHQWLSFAAPDPSFEQFGIFVGALKKYCLARSSRRVR